MDNKDRFKLLNNKIDKVPNQKEEMRQGLKTLTELLPEMIEHQKLKARYLKESYEALKAEGFSEEQALEIVKVNKTPFDS